MPRRPSARAPHGSRSFRDRGHSFRSGFLLGGRRIDKDHPIFSPPAPSPVLISLSRPPRARSPNPPGRACAPLGSSPWTNSRSTTVPRTRRSSADLQAATDRRGASDRLGRPRERLHLTRPDARQARRRFLSAGDQDPHAVLSPPQHPRPDIAPPVSTRTLRLRVGKCGRTAFRYLNFRLLMPITSA